jgi:hypothetical protein
MCSSNRKMMESARWQSSPSKRICTEGAKLFSLRILPERSSRNDLVAAAGLAEAAELVAARAGPEAAEQVAKAVLEGLAVPVERVAQVEQVEQVAKAVPAAREQQEGLAEARLGVLAAGRP